MVIVDASELLAFARHVETAVDRAEPQYEQITERAALNVKRGAQDRVQALTRGRYLKHYPRSITYDMLSPLEAEIGPDPAKLQGGMGPGVEFGSKNTAPKPHLHLAFEDEMPRYEEHVLRATMSVLR
jgi:hypothetical protein